MPLPLIGAAASVFAGPIGGVLSSVLGGVMGGGGAGEVASGAANLFQGIGGAFKKLFGRKRRRKAHHCPPRPQPFQRPNPNAQAQLATIQNQLSQINDLLGQLSSKLDQMAKQQAEAAAAKAAQQAQVQLPTPQPQPEAPPAAAAPAPAIATPPEAAQAAPATSSQPAEAPATAVAAVAQAAAAVVEAVMPEGLAKIDWMFTEAKKLMLDELQENQLKGQVMYTNASNMFSMIGEFGSARSTLTYNMIF
jgi:hypothetical protein